MSDIQVVQINPTTGVVSVCLTQSPQLIDGITKLAQIVTLSYLANPDGSSVINPTEGSGLRAAIGQWNFSSSASTDEISLLVTQRTANVEAEVLSRQEGVTTDPTERLQSLSVINIAVDETTFETMTQVLVVNEVGDSIDILV